MGWVHPWVGLGRVGSDRVHFLFLCVASGCVHCPETYNGLLANCEFLPIWVGSGRLIQFLMARVGWVTYTGVGSDRVRKFGPMSDSDLAF